MREDYNQQLLKVEKAVLESEVEDKVFEDGIHTGIILSSIIFFVLWFFGFIKVG